MFWLTSLQNTFFPFSLATYEEPRVKKNVMSKKNFSLISITHDATMHDARVERWLLFSTFFFPQPRYWLPSLSWFSLSTQRSSIKAVTKPFSSAPVYLNTCLDSQKKKKHYLITFCLMTRMQSSPCHARLLLHRAVSWLQCTNCMIDT